MTQSATLYYFRGTTLQTDDIPIIQYLAYDQSGQLMEKIDIFHDGRCQYSAGDDTPLTVGSVDLTELEAQWSYGTAAKCSESEFEAMKQLALELAKRQGQGPELADDVKPKGLF